MRPIDVLLARGVASGGGLPTVTWNPIDRATYISLSGGNLTATCIQNAAYYSVRATLSKSSGKHYFEVRHDVATAANYCIIGVCTSAHLVNSGYFCDDANGWGYYEQTGTKITTGTGTAYGASYTAGDVIGVAIDLASGKIWFAKNGTWQGSGDPAAGTGEAYSSLSGALFPVLSLYSGGGVNSQMTGRFKSSDFTYTPPSGFSAWGG